LFLHQRFPQDNSLLNYFKSNSFQVFKRSEVLGLVTKNTQCLAVAGTHGKTTTTSILAHLLYQNNKKVTAFIGGISENYQSNLYTEVLKFPLLKLMSLIDLF